MECVVELDELEDQVLVAAFLREAGDRSTRRAAALVPGITHDDVARWRGDRWTYLSAEKRNALIAYFTEMGPTGVHLLWTVADERRSSRSPRRDPPPDDVTEMFANLTAVTRFLEGIAPAGEATDVKMDALEGYRRMITARRSLPRWWPELKRKIEAGEV